MKSVRVEFRLSMPGRASWNGRWSGEDKNYTIVRTLTASQAALLFRAAHGYSQPASFFHRWSDGWCAEVSARILRAGERPKKSDGFHGYDWMVDNIIAHGKTTAPGQVVS